MTGYLLDTNIISDMIKPKPQEAVLRWLEGQQAAGLFLAAVSLGETRRGVTELPPGRKREALEQWYAGPEGPRQWFNERIIAFDWRAAEAWADLSADGRRKGRPRSPIDMMIAATALVHGLTVVSMNQRDFEGVVAHLNPLRP